MAAYYSKNKKPELPGMVYADAVAAYDTAMSQVGETIAYTEWESVMTPMISNLNSFTEWDEFSAFWGGQVIDWIGYNLWNAIYDTHCKQDQRGATTKADRALQYYKKAFQ